jgi:hypothetical protein
MDGNADPSVRAVYDVGLRPHACWDCGFESSQGHGCLSHVNVLCCQVDLSATESYRLWCVLV